MSVLDKVFRWLGHGRYRSSLPTAASNGDVVEQLVDAYGRLQVVFAAAAPVGATAVRQKTAAQRGTLKASAGSVLELAVWNNSEEPVWVQIHDKASAASNGETCVDQVYCPAGGTVGWRPLVPVACATQVRWAASTTPGTLTEVGSNCVGFSGAVL